MRIRINKEFQDLIPALSSEEFDGLKKSILSDGCLDKLIVWHGTIIDGHNRFKICSENKVKYATQEMKFKSRDDAKIWIIKNQFSRRNLSSIARAELALRMENLISKKAKENQRKSGGSVHHKCDKPVNTLRELGKIAGMSHNTLAKARVILKEKPELKEKIERGQESIDSAYRKIGKNIDAKYWLVPRDLYEKLNDEFQFDCDPCPYPSPEGYNGLTARWGKSNFVNPPFRRGDIKNGGGPTAFVRKAIREAKNGKTSVFLLPVPHYINLLLESGAELRSVGRVRWLEINSRKPMPSPGSIVMAVLRRR
jgi:predicted DNA-binding protein (MmcQ/YjbR family)